MSSLSFLLMVYQSMFQLRVFNFQLIVHLGDSSELFGFGRDVVFLLFGFHHAAQRNSSVGGDYFDILRDHGEIAIFHQRLSDLLGCRTVRFAISLIARQKGGAVAVANVSASVVNLGSVTIAL